MNELHMPHETAREAPGREFLSFVLGNEEYGIDILKVQEIRGYDAVTKIAHTPAFIKGVINLRGAIVPIVDLRIRFGQSTAEYDAFTVVIILNLSGRIAGIVVDGVSDVIELNAGQILPVPDLIASIDLKYLMGLGTLEERMLILVDIERLMTSQEIGLIDTIIQEHARSAA